MANDEEKKELAPVFGTNVEVAETSRMMKAMEETAGEGARMSDVSFMSFSGKRGVYKIGQEGREPGAQEPFLVAITMFELGYMCWKGGKPASKRMANIQMPMVAEPDPTEFGPFDEKKGEGWFRARAITAKSLEEGGEQVYFAINSKSGVAVLSDLQREVMARMKAGQPCWPIVYFDREEFESQGFKNFKPVLDIAGWVSTEQVQTLADPDVNPMSLLDGGDTPKKEEEKPEPQKRRRL